VARTILAGRIVSDAYNDALQEQAKKNVWDTLADEAKGMSGVEYASLVADIAGIFDPTPASDVVGGVLSLAQGDLLGAGLSVGSMIPYAGDAIAKPLKIAKRAPKTAKALEALLKQGDDLAAAGRDVLEKTFKLSEVAAARRKALDRVQQAMLDARNKVPGCVDCKKLPEEGRRMLQMPSTNGTWKTPDGLPPSTGNGMFALDQPKVLPDGRVVKEIEFRNGAPNFDDYVVGQKHDLWQVTGDVEKDAVALKRQMRETNPDWTPPSSADYVLHHFEDGAVGYVPRVIHDKRLGGVAHTGGNSMTNNDLF
jgi:hypothetical protein